MRAWLQIIGLGLLTGSRSVAPLALLSGYLADRETTHIGGLTRVLGRRTSARLLRLMMVGELAGDKIPGIPARIETPALMGRMMMAGFVGGTINRLYGRSRLFGTLLGAVAALFGAFTGYHWRMSAVEEGDLPDPLVAGIEDTIVLGGARALLALTPRRAFDPYEALFADDSPPPSHSADA